MFRLVGGMHPPHPPLNPSLFLDNLFQSLRDLTHSAVIKIKFSRNWDITSAVATGGPGWPCSPYRLLVPPPPPPFRFTQNTFLKHHVTIRQQAIMETGRITLKHMPLSHFGDFDCASTANQFAVQSQRSLRGVTIRRGFAMLCAFTEIPQRLYGDCAETTLRIDSQCSRSQSRQMCERQ